MPAFGVLRTWSGRPGSTPRSLAPRELPRHPASEGEVTGPGLRSHWHLVSSSTIATRSFGVSWVQNSRSASCSSSNDKSFRTHACISGFYAQRPTGPRDDALAPSEAHRLRFVQIPENRTLRSHCHHVRHHVTFSEERRIEPGTVPCRGGALSPPGAGEGRWGGGRDVGSDRDAGARRGLSTPGRCAQLRAGGRRRARTSSETRRVGFGARREARKPARLRRPTSGTHASSPRVSQVRIETAERRVEGASLAAKP